MQMDRAALRRTAPATVASRNPVICVVDDDDLYRQYLAALLKANNCRVLEASRGLDLIELMEEHEIDCVLLDYNLVTENGLSVHQQIKDRFRDAPPILMLTVETNERTIIKAFRGGISDYILKRDLRPDELFSAIASALEHSDEEKAKNEELARLRQKSDFDDETGLYTAQHMEGRLAQMTRRGGHARCAVILIAPTGLEEISAKLGQAIGDRVFRTFASRLRALVRQSDICGRYQEAKFIYLVDVDVRHKTVSAICARLATELSLHMNFEGLALGVAPAIGAAIHPFDGGTARDVLACAEQSLERCQTDAMPYCVASAAEHADADAAQPDHGLQRADDPGPASGVQRDRRSARRQRVLKRARIFLPTVPSAIECTIRDISSNGARLRVSAPLMAPEQFEVALGNSNDRTPVVLRWKTSNELGVQFVHVQPQLEQ
jgi:diguanylate cyclase (GGDEF)-like protein